MTEERVPYLDEYPQDARFLVLREATGHSSRITIERIYIEAMGNDVLGGLFVSQLIFWSGKAKRRDGWFYRSADEWLEKDYLNRYQVDKYTRLCVEAGWLESKIMRANGAPTRHYRIRQAAFVEWLHQHAVLSKSANPSVEISKTQDLLISTKPEHTPTYTDPDKPAAPAESLPPPDDGANSLPARVFQRLEKQWLTVGPTQLDQHTRLAQHYGFDAWLAAFDATKNGSRSNAGYVERVIQSLLDKQAANGSGGDWTQLNDNLPDYMRG